MNYLIFFGLFIPFSIFAQMDKMSINKKNGGGDEIQLFNNQQITFQSATDNDVMYIKKNDGTTDIYKLSDVNTIIFDGISAIDDDISKLFKLENYPNPFQESTNISYSLEKASNVEISIYDFTGNLIKTIVSELQESGYHISIWDGTNSELIKVGSGFYFCQIKIDNTEMIKQIFLIN
ncbi:MAG: Por secretion system C-terminal sorting protein [Ignavibacteria bacterium]|nr:Por secretion system C-terminal sorting protein [Ignavibacteria bacterium]